MAYRNMSCVIRGNLLITWFQTRKGLDVFYLNMVCEENTRGRYGVTSNVPSFMFPVLQVQKKRRLLDQDLQVACSAADPGMNWERLPFVLEACLAFAVCVVSVL